MTAITQRWRTGFGEEWTATYEQFARDRAVRRRERIEIADTGSVATVNTIRHSLGYVPSGVLIINQVTSPAAGTVGWYRETTDSDWTDSTITLRFDNNNARVLLEVF
jgi:hypothetical protein